ncbi:hypothetical protein [Veillonella sp. 3310]|uniref:hypothetical protein n=1 Tax=Veillonella sp. 3310 TaxID=2490956 RepID=UPI000FD65D88|nr:hypothetical protein [Veillonella sp. 3310]
MTERYIEASGRFNITIKVKDYGQEPCDEEMLREILHAFLGKSSSKNDSIDILYDYEIVDENIY